MHGFSSTERVALGVGLVCLAMLVPACDCAGGTGTGMGDAGDAGGGGDGGPDAGPRDSGPRPDTNVDASADGGGTDGGVLPDGCVVGTETCNGMDDDCDGMTDEGVVQACGSSIGTCRMGTQACSAGSFGMCTGGVTPIAEICGNGLDDDCNELVDDGCSCTNGQTQPCGSGVGTCVRGTQTCAMGVWGACAGGTGPAMEACDGLDNDCDGTIDNGCGCTAGATQACGSSTGVCMPGMQTCIAGAWSSCVGGVQPMTEVCDGLDNDCNGTADDGNPGGGGTCGSSTGVCTPGTTQCMGGALVCVGASMGSPESCNGMDDDCDGNVDEGNPGGGVACGGGMDVGGCVARTACVMGAIVCRGTFVAPFGTNTNPGSSAMPVGSIAQAVANAVAIGGGADVCVCDTSAAGASTFTEDVTMVEGTSVLGGFDCNSWVVTAGRTTVLAETDDDGLVFPPGITTITALDHMSVTGHANMAASAQTAAITITNASPTLSTDVVSAGAAATAIGLRVVQMGGVAAPVVTNGQYAATGAAGGTAVAVSLEASHPSFSMVTIGGASSGIGAVATTSYGVRCTDCAGTTFMGGSSAGGGATTTGYGFYGTGNLAGVTATGTNFGGGQTTGNGSTSYGVRLETCMGAPTFTNDTANGGFPAGVMTTRTAFASSGAMCAPVIDGGRYVGCELGVNCYGIDASASSPLVVRNVTPGPGGAPVGVQASTGGADVGIGLRCTGGACASITNNQIAVGPMTRSGPTGVALWIDGGSAPSVDLNRITGPNGGSAIAIAAPQFYAVFLRATTSVLTNNVIHDGNHAQIVEDVHWDMASDGPLVEPTLANNTLDYSSCATCGTRVGIVIIAPAGAPSRPAGIFRNNIVHNVGMGGISGGFAERNAVSDPRVFENNALWDPTASSGAVYLDEGTMPLAMAASINALTGAAGNQVVDCMVSASFHLPMASACVNTGTLMSCPTNDIDGAGTRPFPAGGMCDIGADEFHP
jgi:hypothetical protein